MGRIFNTYGPNMQPHDGRVISNFIMQALQDLPITIFGDGRQSRAFCYVADLIEAIVRFMDTPEDFYGPLNLGHPEEFSIRELADLVVEMTGSKSKIVRKTLPRDDPRQRCPDISLAKKELKWSPSIELREGLAKTIPHFEELLRKA